MKTLNSTTNLLILSLIIILGFFLLNNISHMGFLNIGHNHDESNIMGMMMHEHNEHNGEEFTNHEIYSSSVVNKIKNKENIILLDVRTPEEYKEIHLENSFLLPVGDMSQATLTDIGLGEDAKDKEIIIYCRSGGRSKQAYDIMNSLGYTNIKSVAGGMINWQEGNYPFTEIGEYVPKEIFIKTNKDFASISFDKIIHSFGNILQSAGIVDTVFVITNTGEGLLTIGELSTSCGCTTAEISKKNIKSGNSATLTVYFNPDFHDEPLGEITRTVFIPTNDPAQLEAEVEIIINILEGE